MIFFQAFPAAAEGDSLLLASVNNIPPYVYVEDGELTGISVDIINELAHRGGFSVEIETFPWARVMLLLEKGQIDGAFSAYETEKRKAFCLYTGRVHYDELRIATRKGGMFVCAGVKSLYGKVVGKGRNVYVSEEFNEAVSKGKIILEETDDMKMTNIKKLIAGRLDAVIGSPAAMMHYAKKLGVDKKIVIAPGALKEKIPAYLVLSKHSPLQHKSEWQAKLTRIINGMWEDGTVQTINARYGVTDE
ncbi:transporter substrate-binding domain-containing protein [Pseudodesulfovibrio cashew]|uniref:Transporter substrate-binding domain-containing protein n=1 Tax=Pseudodesulfovibrio cashew TaxID=2678688 RepID=A0A6I6JHZ3_9BACT|nr:transporter substrate-binding domain-containing protein [Pseudodesulfovibrio cashew]QGY41821.1 transporter substrate-binding domain-containing protein [Pseudodesulfovibrio cashew]